MGESIAEGTLSRWMKNVGDEVKRDEPMFEISTDKVDAEVSAEKAGVIAEILVEQGQTVAVGTVVARIETDVAAFASGGASASAPQAAAAAPAANAPAKSAEKTAEKPAPARTATETAPPARPRADAGSNGGNGSSLEERLRTKSSPLVRRMAADAGVELSSLSGTGVAGRVTKRDLISYLESPPAAAPASAPARPAAASAPAAHAPHGPLPTPWAGDVVEPMSRIRQLTAEHMVLAKHTAMHVTTVFEVDLTRVARIRAANKSEFERRTGEKLTYLPFVVQSVIAGLKKYPILNAAVAGTDIIYRKSYNIGIAVALEWGLIVPVVHNADDLSLSGLAKALNDLSNRARTKKLKPEEVQDCSFSITNHGVFGSLFATPIVPVPTTGILGIGAIEKRPKVRTGPDGEDVIALRTCAYLSLSFDHRVVDGSDGDGFVGFVKNHLETMPEPVL